MLSRVFIYPNNLNESNDMKMTEEPTFELLWRTNKIHINENVEEGMLESFKLVKRGTEHLL